MFTAGVMSSSEETNLFYFFMFLLQFEKPGSRKDYDYPDMAKEAGAGYCSLVVNGATCRIWWELCHGSNRQNSKHTRVYPPSFVQTLDLHPFL